MRIERSVKLKEIIQKDSCSWYCLPVYFPLLQLIQVRKACHKQIQREIPRLRKEDRVCSGDSQITDIYGHGIQSAGFNSTCL